MRGTTIIFIGLVATAVFGFFALPVFAQINPNTPQEDIGMPGGTFGEFEVGLPGLPKGSSIDRLVGTPDPILQFINLAVNAVIAILVIIGLITIVIAGYIYMTAAGDASKVKLAKEMIIAALAGIFLSLVSVIILNTINKYIGSDAQEPALGSPSPGAEGVGSAAGNAGLGAGAGSGGNINKLPGGGNSNAKMIAELQADRNGYINSINEIKTNLSNGNLTAEEIKLQRAEMRNLEKQLADVEDLIFRTQLSP
ncbi:MAG TPA: pilin [Candidatus Andersenbacteria bacterium]|nr:pilin [Candidatus Andersenbacteria bacterium]